MFSDRCAVQADLASGLNCAFSLSQFRNTVLFHVTVSIDASLTAMNMTMAHEKSNLKAISTIRAHRPK